jgi:hypothetical protein
MAYRLIRWRGQRKVSKHQCRRKYNDADVASGLVETETVTVTVTVTECSVRARVWSVVQCLYKLGVSYDSLQQQQQQQQ